MKKIILGLFILINNLAFSQVKNNNLEKTIFNLQVGILGTWLSNETKLTNEIALKSEFGMDAGFRGCSDCETLYALTPEVTLEPRWYYNMDNRIDKGKIIKNNSANFATISFRYYPDWFNISNDSNISIQNQITIIPKWGIKRTIANSNFSYELGIGLGKRYYFDSRQWDTTADLLVRIGYTFIRK